MKLAISNFRCPGKTLIKGGRFLLNVANVWFSPAKDLRGGLKNDEESPCAGAWWLSLSVYTSKEWDSWNCQAGTRFLSILFSNFLSYLKVVCSWGTMKKIIKSGKKMMKDLCSTCIQLAYNPFLGSSNLVPSILFRNKRFLLDEMFQWNASKFAIFIEKENQCSFFRFSFWATLSFPLWMPWSMST